MRNSWLRTLLARPRECLLALVAAAACATASSSSAQPPAPVPAAASLETLVPPEPAPADPWAEINALRQRLDQLESLSEKQKGADAAKKAADAKKPTVKWSGQLQADQLWFNQDAANQAQFGDIENGAVIRRARLAMLGDYGLVDYRIEFDFALAGRPTFLDVWAGYRDLPVLGRVRVGHFFEPFSLERLTANRFQTYMDRSQVDQAFAPSRNLGVAAGDTIGDDESGTWALGLYRTNSNIFGDDVGDRFESSVTGRVTLLPWYENDGLDLLHLGFAGSYRYADNGVARFAAGPEVRLGATVPGVPNFIDTGLIAARTYQLLGWEVAWVRGPFSLQSEFVLTPVNSDFDGSLFFTGWYVDASYFLTGEHRPYRRESGIFDRVQPCRDFLRLGSDGSLETGPGAWQVAARLSEVNLNSGAVQGGEQLSLTLALNWHLNQYTRFSLDYVRSWVDNGGDSTCDSFGTRFGFEF